MVDTGRVMAWRSTLITEKLKRFDAARGVVFATGQYDSNPRLMGPLRRIQFVAAPRRPSAIKATGSFIAAEQGAALKVMHWNLTLLLGYHVKGESVDGQPLMRGAVREVAFPLALS